jgi:hypothetical protein
MPVPVTSTVVITGRGASERCPHPAFLLTPAMQHHPDVPELLEQYMEATGTAGCWVTVRELRAFFMMDESAGPAFSGFLQRIHHGSFPACRYRVTRMEKFRDSSPPYRIIKKYFVQARPAPRLSRAPVSGEEQKNR